MTPVAPRRPAGLELLGPSPDAGIERPSFLLRRSDGQIARLGELSYAIVCEADGRASTEELTTRVSARTGRPLTPSVVTRLIRERLEPAGLLLAGAPPNHLPRADALLALRLRFAALPGSLVARIARPLTPLFSPVVVCAALVALLSLDVALLVSRPVTGAFASLVADPVALVIFIVLALTGVLVHEFGHATGCRSGGGRPGAIGVGVYIVWPVLYCDLTDTYRLGRRDRLRADAGGIYFSGLWALAAAVGYLLTGYEPLLALAVAQHLEMALQALPLLRFDGHFIISDLIGVPDAMSRVRPALVSMLPGRPEPAAMRELTPRATNLLRAYAAITFPALAAILVVVVLSVPAIVGRAVDTAIDSAGQLPGADLAGVAESLGRTGLALLPVIGLAFTFFLIGRRLVRGLVDAPALVAGQILEGLLIGLVVLYASFYLALGGETNAALPALAALLAVGALTIWPPRRAHDASDPQLRRARERRGF